MKASLRGLLRAFGAVAMPAALVAVISSDAPTSRTGRQLSFAERVRAQETIERIYYSHQVGATAPFEEAVPPEVLERKVRTYLRQSAALERLWKTPVTAQMLRREAERMAQGTRMPERLAELYAALGDDPVLILECLARPSLVDRLARNFQAFDAQIHGESRQAAETLRRQIAGGQVDPSAEDPRRRVVEITRDDDTGGSAAPSMPPDLDSRRPGDPVREALPSERFDRWVDQLPAELGGIGPIQEERDAFRMWTVLERDPDRVNAVSYRIAKRSWDEWWASAGREFADAEVPTVAGQDQSVPAPGTHGLVGEAGQVEAGPSACPPNDTWDNASLDDVPDGRAGFTAVWTGTVMVIWGGRDVLSLLGTGSRYDPATDTWTSTSNTNAPSARSNHTAVWTGGRMVVWGGEDRLTFLNTGGQYEPVTDTWMPVSTTSAPSPRRSHSAVWTGDRMVVWGGEASLINLNTGGRYDPVTNTWMATSTTNAPSARRQHSAVWTGALMVVWGGFAGGAIGTGGRYDPTIDAWTPTSLTDAPSARYGHTAVWTGGLMIVWGGNATSFAVETNTGGRYDPATDAWTPTSITNVPLSRSFHTAVWTGALMVVWGGRNGADLVTGGRYDPATDAWTTTSTVNAPSARSSYTAEWTGSLMVVWGGISEDNQLFNTGSRYDPATDTWTPTAVNVATPRYRHTAVWTGGLMILWGGYDDVTYFDTGGRYDPVIDAWTPTSTANAPSARAYHSAVWTGSQMIVWGGDDGSALVNTGGRYDPTSDVWASTFMAHAPAPRYRHTAVWTGSLMVVWGGFGGFDTGGRYDPVRNRWTPTAATNAPSGRYGHTAVWTGSEMVVWGGTGGNTGGRYDPAIDAWTPTSLTDAPSGRSGHTAVWTGGLMIVWGGGGELDTGGRYDPATDTWTATSTMNAPLGRASHTAVWTGNLMVVWGGGEETFVGTGGRYDPATDTWTPTSTTNAPSRRYGHTAVWTGSLMIEWGGAYENVFGTGGRYVLLPDEDGDGFSECSGDCDIADAAVYPGAPQLCGDGVNNDCDHPQWPLVAGTDEADDDADTQSECGGDCDDADPGVYLGAPESCDGLATDCADPSYPGTPAAELDVDGDGYRRCEGVLPVDCFDDEPNVWALPGEVPELGWLSSAQLGWSPPDPPGGVPPFGYSQVRSPAAADFVTGASCLASSGSTSPSAQDPETPPPGGIFYYLVRARNTCGYGTWGSASDGGQQPVLGCP